MVAILHVAGLACGRRGRLGENPELLQLIAHAQLN